MKPKPASPFAIGALLLSIMAFCVYLLLGFDPDDLANETGQFVNDIYRAAGGQYQR